MTKYKKDPIPKNMGREELAKFWDTHSIADYSNELKPIKVEVSKNLSNILPIRISSSTLSKLQNEASKKGVGASTLVRMKLMEWLGV